MELKQLMEDHFIKDLSSITKEIRWVLLTQIILIFILFILLILKPYLLFLFNSYTSYIEILINAITIGVFFYFIEALYDFAKAMIDMISFNSSTKRDE